MAAEDTDGQISMDSVGAVSYTHLDVYKRQVRKPYGERKKRTEYPEKKSQRDESCEAIDAALERKPKDLQELIGILQEAGYEYKDGKQPALRGKGHARFARFRSCLLYTSIFHKLNIHLIPPELKLSKHPLHAHTAVPSVP